MKTSWSPFQANLGLNAQPKIQLFNRLMFMTF